MQVVKIGRTPTTPLTHLAAPDPACDRVAAPTQNRSDGGTVIKTHVSGIAQLRRIVRHQFAALLWLIGAAFVVSSFPLDNAHIARAGLFVALIAVVITVRDLARNVITRVCHVISLYEEDVQLDPNAPECLVSDLSRARRLRDASRRARRIVP